MTLQEIWSQTVTQVRTSPLVTGAISLVTILTIMFCIFLILLGVTFLLRMFFKNHPTIDMFHKTFLYVVTMSGVIVLLVGGVLGLALPLIPGALLIILGLVLLRKYHRSEWMDRHLVRLTIKMRLKHSWRRFLGLIRRYRKKKLYRKEQMLQSTMKTKPRKNGKTLK